MLKLKRYLKPFTWSTLFVLLLVFLQTQTDLYLPTLMSDIINKGVMNGDTSFIWQTGGYMLAIAGAGALFSIIASMYSAKIAGGVGRDLRRDLFRNVTAFSLHEFDQFGTSTLITRTTNDITQVQSVLVMMLRMMLMAPMMMIGGIIMAVQEDKALTWVLVVAIPVLILTIIILATVAIPLFKTMQQKIDRINLVLREKLTGIRVIRAFNRIVHESKRFDAANKDLTDNYIKVNRIMAFLMPTLMLVMNFTQLAILWFGILRIDAGNMQIGSLMAFTQYAMQIMFSMVMVSMMFIMVPRASAAAVRIAEVLDTKPGIDDPEGAGSCGIQHGHIAFENVSFRYHGAEQPAISNISFSAKPGEVTAIIGSTGSGKSTLVNLITRFYDVENGRVLIDGVDVREMTQECLRSKIGFVPQKAMLFSGQSQRTSALVSPTQPR
jgi:ATP-binding cassette, subfamily B, multidrug efflux pump